MDIVEYDQVDPLGVLELNLVSLGYPLTPELASSMRRLDSRLFPCFGIYAIEGGTVVGQVLLYRLPMVSVQGQEDVGGVAAVCTHPAYSRAGIADRLLEEAHARMCASGLRFSTLGTTRWRGAYALYRRQGYQDVQRYAYTFAPCERVHPKDDLRAERAGLERLRLTDEVFGRAAAGRTGFAYRPARFIPMLVETRNLDADEVWLLFDQSQLAGYALARISDQLLQVTDLSLVESNDTAAAIVALARELPVAYLQVRVNHPSEAECLQQAGFPPPRPDWGTFMLKPLTSDVTTNDAIRLFGFGTERFLISWLDVT